MEFEVLFASVFVIAMFCGVFIVFLGLRQRSQQLEMRHRERMAMIERGQVPLDSPAAAPRHLAPAASSRLLSIGIMIIGLGLALMMIISVAGDTPDVGVGVGGAIAIVGAAFVVRSLVVKPLLTPAPKTIEPPEEAGL
jgi:hypothetical protein